MFRSRNTKFNDVCKRHPAEEERERELDGLDAGPRTRTGVGLARTGRSGENAGALAALRLRRRRHR